MSETQENNPQETYQPIKKFSFTFLIPTVGFVGLIPFAPGTFGSLVAVIDFTLFFLFYKITGPAWPLLFFIGWFFTYRYCLMTKKHDPKEVVIDEFVGQQISLHMVYYYIIFFVPELFSQPVFFIFLIVFFNFILFRYFDIIKPGLVGYFDRQDNAFSIMMDDVVAGVFAALISIFLIFIVNFYV